MTASPHRYRARTNAIDECERPGCTVQRKYRTTPGRKTAVAVYRVGLGLWTERRPPCVTTTPHEDKPMDTPTRERIIATTISAPTREQRILRIADANIASALLTIERYKIKLDEDPVSALRECDDLFDAAASLDVNREVRDALTELATVESTRAYLTHEVFRFSRLPGPSTSPTKNLSRECRAVACVALLDRIEVLK